jgi:hypothetical protein
MPNLITTDSAYLSDLDYDNLSTADQAKVNALCGVVTQLIQKHCHRIFAADDYEEYHDGQGHEDSIFVLNPPINSLTSIVVVASENTTYDDSVFDFDANTGEIWWDRRELVDSTLNYLGYFPCGRRNLIVTYNGGWEDVPDPIEMVAGNLIMEMFDPSLQTSENMDMEKLGQYQYRLKKDSADRMIHSNKKILDLYKLRRVTR